MYFIKYYVKSIKDNLFSTWQKYLDLWWEACFIRRMNVSLIRRPGLRRIIRSSETAVYHVISRTAYKRFTLGDNEKEMFRRMMWRQAAFCGVEVLSFCVMSNHFHILVRVPQVVELADDVILERYRNFYDQKEVPPHVIPPDVVEEVFKEGGHDADVLRERLKARMQDLSVFVKELKQRFGIWYNATHGNHGTLWSDRFKSVLVENHSFAMRIVSAYIHLNPVRAKICKNPEDYRWSGYSEALGGGRSCKRRYSGVCY